MAACCARLSISGQTYLPLEWQVLGCAICTQLLHGSDIKVESVQSQALGHSLGLRVHKHIRGDGARQLCGVGGSGDVCGE